LLFFDKSGLIILVCALPLKQEKRSKLNMMVIILFMTKESGC